ncbi:hypothetical protein SASPL_132672 [Salvia splendens]|uniref:Aquaporin NIP n=1 Tax=Salvia splendens TaxID=180675 RepID=A0A8X8WZX0_SALSN|nr:hypothetical protein SASPL_132672 [Salvia splendens]
MAETSNGNGVVVHIKEDDFNRNSGCCSLTVPFIQKIIAETLGTFFLIFAGCGAVAVNADKDKVITLPGIAIVWGLVVMVMVYSVGHISGAHFNPAVTLAFATCKRFPWKQIGELAGLAVGAVILLNVMFAGEWALQADIGSINESGKESRTGYSVEQFQRHMDLYGWPNSWCHCWSLGLQYRQIY